LSPPTTSSLDDGRVQWDICPRACKLRDDQRGTCSCAAAASAMAMIA